MEKYSDDLLNVTEYTECNIKITGHDEILLENVAVSGRNLKGKNQTPRDKKGSKERWSDRRGRV